MMITAEDTPFAERLRTERERLGINQTRFAQMGGVSRTAQWQYEVGKHAPGLDYLSALAQNGVDVVFLLTGRHVAAEPMDWDVLREAFLMVVRRRGSGLVAPSSPEQLFDAFQTIVSAAMGRKSVKDVQHVAGCSTSSTGCMDR